MVYYSDEQVSKLLDEILVKMPINDQKLIGVIKFIKNKKENLKFHI